MRGAPAHAAAVTEGRVPSAARSSSESVTPFSSRPMAGDRFASNRIRTSSVDTACTAAT
ncbi:unnamed protein product, partial [Nesidiocoris tenuis]